MNAHGMTYDDARDRIVVFGGATDAAVNGLTYEWRGDGWHIVAVGGPEPRTFPAMAYAGALGGTVLFGGNRVLFGNGLNPENLFFDTWIWNGNNWRQVVGDGPGPRAEAAMAYDPVEKQIILFGGYHIVAESIVPLGDTWAFDGTSWSKRADTGPPPQNGASMAYDPDHQTMILFGQNKDRTTGETWAWLESGWQLLPEGQSERRYNSAMAYDPGQHQIIRFGGWTGEGRSNDTWAWSGSEWNRVSMDGPPARNHTQMVYDNKRNRVTLFGGHDGENIFGDIWHWQNITWTYFLDIPYKERVANNH